MRQTKQETSTVIFMLESSMFSSSRFFLYKKAHLSFQALHGRWW